MTEPIARHLEMLQSDGITALKGAFESAWVDRLRDDMMTAFWPSELWPRFEEHATRKYPRRGDISARSALTVHRGTNHVSQVPRPVLVLGVDAPGAGHAALHDMMVTKDYYENLPASTRRHLVCRVVDELVPVTQKHDIEGLVLSGENPGPRSYQ